MLTITTETAAGSNDFTDGYLTYVDFTDGYLTYADLSDGYLTYADLSGSFWSASVAESNVADPPQPQETDQC